MRLPESLRIIAPGSAIFLVTGIVGARLALPILFSGPPSLGIAAAGVAIFALAPLSLLGALTLSWAGASFSVPVYMVILAVFAVAALPFHPIVRRRWAASVTIAGMVAWVLCQAYLAIEARIL
jgi:hypothetical protein